MPPTRRTHTLPADEYIGLAEAAAHWGVSVRTVRRAISDGSLPAYRVRNLVRVKMADVAVAFQPIPTAKAS